MPPKLRLITRAPWSTAQWIALASASGEIVPSLRTTLATRSSAGKAMPAIPCVVVQRGGDLAGDECAMAVRVALPGAADEAGARGDLTFELRVVGVDAGVDHGHANARKERQLAPGLESMNAVEVPLARGERVVRREREASRVVAEPLDPADAANRAETVGVRGSDRQGEGRDLRDPAAGASLDPLCDEPG